MKKYIALAALLAFISCEQFKEVADVQPVTIITTNINVTSENVPSDIPRPENFSVKFINYNDKIEVVQTTDANGNTVISYDPDNLDRALLVIQKIHQLGHINDQEYEIAKGQLENNQIGLLYPTDTSTYTYFTDAVYTQVLNDIMTQYN